MTISLIHASKFHSVSSVLFWEFIFADVSSSNKKLETFHATFSTDDFDANQKIDLCFVEIKWLWVFRDVYIPEN